MKPNTENDGIPPYLLPLEGNNHDVHGVLKKSKGGEFWIIEAKPYVTQLAKRLFPGCNGRDKGVAVFPATKRIQSDLAWLMWRYPLEIEDQAGWEEAREATVRHVRRIADITKMPRKQDPVNFQGTLRDFQKEGLAHMINTRSTLVADEMGLGKTVEALAFLSTTNEMPALIVVQPHVILQWVREINNFLNITSLTDGKKKYAGAVLLDKYFTKAEQGVSVHIIRGLKPYPLPVADVYIIHYLLLRGWKNELPEYGIKSLIFDEIQELRHTLTEKYSAASLLSDAAENVFGLSGTPIYNRGGEIWNVLNIIEYGCLGDYGSFTREWCEGFYGDTVADPEVLGDYLRKEGLMLRRRKDDVLTELPPKRRVIQEINVDKGLYGELIQPAIETALAIKGLDKKEYFQKGRMTREAIDVTRMATGVAKAKYVVEFTKTLLDAGERCILVGHHHTVIDIYKEGLQEYDPSLITGRETPHRKDEGQLKFQQAHTNLVIISLRVSTGLNLQRANCVIFGELDWSPAVHCLDEKTEILTNNGFRGVDDVAVGELVAGFDMRDESIRFVPAIAKVDRVAGPDETLHNVRTTKIDLSVTGQHRMVVRRGRRTTKGLKRSGWEIATATELVGKKRRYIPTAGYEFSKGVSLSDNELRLIGLFLSDGSFNGRHLTIYQAAHQPWNEDIVKILNGAGVSWSLFQRGKGAEISNWYSVPAGVQPRWTEREIAELTKRRVKGETYEKIGKVIERSTEAVGIKWRKMKKGHFTKPGPEKPRKGWKELEKYLDKDLSPLLEGATPQQLECLIQGLWLGDGTKAGVNVRHITSTNKIRLERLQSLCVRRGKTAVLSVRGNKTSKGKTVYGLRVSEKREAYLQDGKNRDYFKPEKGPATGKRVWCVENELHTIIVRRNGKVAIVGNSQAEDRCHRMGQEDSVLSYYLVCGEGTDNAIQDALGLKTSQFIGIMGDKGETQDDRLLAQSASRQHMKEVITKLQERKHQHKLT